MKALFPALALGLLVVLLSPCAASAQAKPAKKAGPIQKAQSGKKGQPGKKAKPLAPVLNLKLAAKRGYWCDRSVRYVGWSADGKTIHYREAPAKEGELTPVFACDPATGKIKKLAPKAVWALPPTLHPSLGTARRARGGYPRRRVSPDGCRQVFTRGGDVVLRTLADGKEQRLTHTREAESGAMFSADGKRIFYQRGGDVFSMQLESHVVRQLVYIRTGPKPKPKKPDAAAKTDLQKTLRKQQQKLFKWVKEQRRKRGIREQRAKASKKFDKGAVKTFYTPDGSAAAVAAIAPNGRYLVLRLTKSSAGAAKRTVVPTYVTESGFVETAASRTKVGEPQSHARYGVLDLKKLKLRMIDPLALRDAKAAYQSFQWSPDGKSLASIALAQDYRTRWVLSIDPAGGKAEVVDALHDAAWIGGPAWSRFGWMKDSQRIWYVSEATGYAHLHVADKSGRFRRQLTHGAFEVHNARLSWDMSKFFLITNRKHPGERHLYVMPAEGGEPRCLTGIFPGIDDAVVSPDGKCLLVQHSTPVVPPSLTLIDVSDSKREPRVVRRVARGATDAYLAGRWIAPRVVDFPDRHGNRVYARLYTPERAGPERAAVVHVHGAGYYQYAHKRWQSRPYTYLFIQYLLRQGYHVVDLDYRGSAGYGRDCRTEIYRYMGGTEVDSGAAAIDYLVKHCGVDRARVGLFGGSYGGFYTLMALFTRPGLFRAGVALYPVTDWSHYNHWYTSRILNLPQEDQEAYERSSPIYLAKNLRDRLQIQHGVVDSNVHFQDTMRLVQRLIELEKTGWDLVTYPVEGHGWRTEPSRLDSFRRMEQLFDRALRAPKPAAKRRDI